MPLVGIISDTHGSMPDSVFDVFANCDYIIHAGDIGKPSILWELEAITTTIAVLGNNDWQDYGASVHHECKTIIGGVRVYVTHLPGDAAKAARSGEYGLVIHGHTHTPRDEMVRDCRVVNPGSTTRPRGDSRRSVALVRLEDGVVGPVRFERL